MPEIRGDQLRHISKLFGLSQQALSGVTLIDDENIAMVLDVNPLVRRGLTEANLTGWYEGILLNVHSAGDAEISQINPYEPGSAAVAPYPATVPLDFDVWLLGVGGVRNDGAGGLTEAIVQVNPEATTVGWARDDSGASAAGPSPAFSVARFTDLATTGVGTINDDPMITAQGECWVPVGIRLPRRSVLEFHSLSAAAAEFTAIFLMGLFPATLGQDVLV